MNGNVFSMEIDRGPWQLYDRLTAAAGAVIPTLQFFSAPIGAAKTKGDTNMVQGNRLPPPQKFSLYSLGFLFGADMAYADIVGILRNGWFELRIGQKIFAEGPLQLYPGGGGINGVAAAGAGAAITAWNNGDPTPLSTRRFGPDFARDIPPNVYFGVTVQWGAAVTLAAAPAIGMDLMCVLDGVLDREVQ